MCRERQSLRVSDREFFPLGRQMMVTGDKGIPAISAAQI